MQLASTIGRVKKRARFKRLALFLFDIELISTDIRDIALISVAGKCCGNVYLLVDGKGETVVIWEYKLIRRETVADWKKIKAEYIAGGISYRRLAEKSGVSFNTLKTIAIKERWSELRQQADNKATTVMVESIGEANGTTAVKVNDVADRLLEEINGILDENKGKCDTRTIKDLATALKSIKEIKGGEDEDDSECGVIIMPPIKAGVKPSEEAENE